MSQYPIHYPSAQYPVQYPVQYPSAQYLGPPMPPGPVQYYIVNQRSDDQELQNQKMKKNNQNRCYTCKPRGKVLKHVIGYSSCNNFMFHHDMNHRPIILITPVKHIKSVTEFTGPELVQLFESIKYFCNFWNIIDYQVSYNEGNWKAHDHFHIKIKISDKIANRMRGDHFKRLGLEKNYK